MSSKWIRKYSRKILDPVFQTIMRSVGGCIPEPANSLLSKGLENANFDLYLLRARRYERNKWILKGFHLMNLGDKLVGLGDPLGNKIEENYETKGPVGFSVP